MANVCKSVSLIAGAGLLLAGSSVAAQACATASFITTGCFTTITIVNDIGSGSTTPGFVWVKDESVATLTLAGSSAPVTQVTADFIAQPPEKPLSISLTGFALAGGATSFSIANKDDTKYTLTFFSILAGGSSNLAFVFNGDNPSVEVGHLVATSAPAPIPGAGFLSFLGMGFAGLWRRGKSVATRVLGRQQTATA